MISQYPKYVNKTIYRSFTYSISLIGFQYNWHTTASDFIAFLNSLNLNRIKQYKYDYIFTFTAHINLESVRTDHHNLGESFMPVNNIHVTGSVIISHPYNTLLQYLNHLLLLTRVLWITTYLCTIWWKLFVANSLWKLKKKVP